MYACGIVPTVHFICQHFNQYKVTPEKILSYNLMNFAQFINRKLKKYGVWSIAKVQERMAENSEDPINATDSSLCKGLPLQYARVLTLIDKQFYGNIKYWHVTPDEAKAIGEDISADVRCLFKPTSMSQTVASCRKAQHKPKAS